MKRPIVLLSLLSSVMMFSPQSMGMEESKQGISTVGKKYPGASPFTQELRSIVDNHGNDKDQLKTRVKELYDGQIELQEDFEDFMEKGGFSNDERTLLFDIAKELNLPIIVGTDSHGISLFSIYKGQSIQDKTRINHGPFDVRFNYRAAPDERKLTTFFISDHFTYLNKINLEQNKITGVRLPINLPYLEYLLLGNNQLTQLTLGDMPELYSLHLKGNKIKKLNFQKSNMPKLRHLELENNPLKNLTLPYAVSHHTGLINKDRVIDIAFNGVIPSITAFYCPSGANAFNEKKTVDFSVLDPKKHTFKNMNFLNEVERERNCRKILRWMAACNKS